ncbi:FKBP12-associated protein [Mortierella sp. AM989]|nr:FKBP12-associated protein [Mortierella sp. AM989]
MDHTTSSQGLTPGSKPNNRLGDPRQKGKTVDRSDIAPRGVTDNQRENTSSPRPHTPNNNTRGAGRRQRSQKKDLAGRTFPSASAGTTSTIEANHNHSFQRNNNRKSAPRAPVKFVHRVEEDRGLMEALTIGLTNSTYDCMVCWDIIRPAHKVWSCQIQTTMVGGGDVQVAKTPKFLFLKIIPASVAKSTNQTLIDTSRLTHAENSVDVHENVLIHATCLCSPCEEEQLQMCYCGKHERKARCGEGEPKATLIDGKEQTGYYECQEICQRPLTCGHHLCAKSCHTLDDEPGQCPSRPEAVKTCPCGAKTIESMLMGKERSSCQDPIPVCGGVCRKYLKCGHRCMQKCHLGECSPCKVSVAVDCVCGSTHVQRICSEMGIYGDKQPTCQKLCLGLRSCVTSCKCGHLTKEAVCGSSVENPWDGKSRVIKCNDFCLIAERNKRVALALDIDDSIARGPRVPQFDDYVLDYASANMEFTLKMEKRLAEWVADSTLQRLSLSPMKGHHRKFVHELSAYYNVTSESVDVEPYRSVVIHRKLNTSVPALLASQACRQRRPGISSTSATSNGIEQLRKSNIKDPINAIYLHDLVFGLTRTELSSKLSPIFGSIKYGIRWLTDDDAVLVPHPGNMSMDELEVLLIRLRTGIKDLTSDGQICERVELCWVNKEGEVVSHTNVSQPKRYFNANQGCQLLKKAAAPKVKNTFSLLDDDERIAAAKRVEEERILKAKVASGTLSMEAWEENEADTSFSSSIQKVSRPPSASDVYHSDDSSSSLPSKSTSYVHGKITPKAIVNADQNVVDDWQELLDDDDQ